MSDESLLKQVIKTTSKELGQSSICKLTDAHSTQAKPE